MRQAFRTASLVGLLLFIILLFAFLAFEATHSLVLVSFEYSRAASPYAWAVAAYITFSVLIGSWFPAWAPKRKSKGQAGTPLGQKFMGILAFMVCLLIGWFSEFMIVSFSASYLHLHAPQEPAQLEVQASGVWPTRRALSASCSFQLSFDEPRISPFPQFVCLSRQEAAPLLERDEPFTVALHGNRSYYGYALHY